MENNSHLFTDENVFRYYYDIYGDEIFDEKEVLCQLASFGKRIGLIMKVFPRLCNTIIFLKNILLELVIKIVKKI